MIIAVLRTIKEIHNFSLMGSIVSALRFTALGDAVFILPYAIFALQFFALTAFVGSRRTRPRKSASC
jgi:hypothetical protein